MACVQCCHAAVGGGLRNVLALALCNAACESLHRPEWPERIGTRRYDAVANELQHLDLVLHYLAQVLHDLSLRKRHVLEHTTSRDFEQRLQHCHGDSEICELLDEQRGVVAAILQVADGVWDHLAGLFVLAHEVGKAERVM